VIVGELVIHWIHHGADHSRRFRRQTPGRTVSLVDELGDAKTVARRWAGWSSGVSPRERPFFASSASGSRVGRGRVAASILRPVARRGAGRDDTLVAVRVGERGGCAVHLRASETVEAATVMRIQNRVRARFQSAGPRRCLNQGQRLPPLAP